MPNHPRLVEALTYLDAQRQFLRDAVEATPKDRVAEHPGPDRWSVAEALEHLGIVGNRLAGMLEKITAAAKIEGLGADTETGSILPTMNIDRILDRERKIMSGDGSLPKNGWSIDESWNALANASDMIRAFVDANDGLALDKVTAPHPAFGPLNGYQWLLFVGAHEARHALQIREINEQLRSISPSTS